MVGRRPDGCPIGTGVRALAGRWTLPVVMALLDEPLGFGAIRTRLDGVSANLLTQRLRSLELNGIIERSASDRLYRLTTWGYELEAFAVTLRDWAGPADP